MCPPYSHGIVPLGNARTISYNCTFINCKPVLFRMQTPPDLFDAPSIQAIQTQAAQINKI
jgi:hypothetical protein